MKKQVLKTRIQKRNLPHFHPFVSVIALVLGILGTLFVSHVLAQTTTTTLYACTQNATGIMRYVTNSTSCRPGETLVSWSSGGNATWGSITGTLSNQTDLQSALNTKQDALTSISERHHKVLVNNTPNDLFTFSLANGELSGFTVYLTFRVKKGSDWAVGTYQIQRAFYNDGGALKSTSVSIIAGDSTDNGGAVNAILNYGFQDAITATMNNGVVTLKFNPKDCGPSPDSIDLDYVVINPSGKPLTFL